MIEEVRGIVIRETTVNENNKMLTILGKGKGKFSVLAKNAKKTNSKNFAISQIFAYGDMVLFKKNNFTTITQGDLITNFYDIREDFDKLCIGNYFLEMTNKLIYENIEFDDVLYLLIKGLNKLTKTTNPKLVLVVFRLKFLQLIGHYPATEFCYMCGKEYKDFNTAFFSVNGLLCEDCAPKSHRKHIINNTCIYTLNYIYINNIDNIFNFNIPEDTINLLDKSINVFMDYNFDIKFKSLLYL